MSDDGSDKGTTYRLGMFSCLIVFIIFIVVVGFVLLLSSKQDRPATAQPSSPIGPRKQENSRSPREQSGDSDKTQTAGKIADALIGQRHFSSMI
jgi:hypothetical protein